MLLQADGSNHDCLEGRGPKLTLIAFIEDATNEVSGASFRNEEDAAGDIKLILGPKEEGRKSNVDISDAFAGRARKDSALERLGLYTLSCIGLLTKR
jgi:hypothetical protein